jgi:hypothetical protein
MAFVVYEGERKLADVVTRAYGDLKAADRRRAEAALVRANPHLAEIADVAKGSLIVVPAVPGVDAPAEATVFDTPAAEAVASAADACGEFEKQLQDSVKAEADRLTALAALLKSNGVIQLLDRAPQARPYVERVTKAAKARGDELDSRRQALTRLDDAVDQLKELAVRLR